MSAFDVLKNLGDMNHGSLGLLPRILLITDGTLTEILEAAFLERIQVAKVSQQLVTPEPDQRWLAGSTEHLLQRKVILTGATSSKTYVYAESFIAVGQLSPEFREELMNSSIPLGRLWLEHRLETFKRLQNVNCQPAGDLSRYFGCAEDARLLVRTYHVFSAARPVLAITEYFPALLEPLKSQAQS
jgi:chorismate-pyruvate lyase